MDSDLDVRRRRAIYRAQHRGTKEMDLILGRFAEARVPTMGADVLGRFEALLALPDPDLQNAVLVGGAIGPAELHSFFDELRGFHGLAVGK